MSARLAILVLVAVAGFAATTALVPQRAVAQATLTTVTTPSASDATTKSAAPGKSVRGAFDRAFWKIVLLSLLVSLVWVIPAVIDLFKSYGYQKRRMRLFEDLTATTPPRSVEEIESLIASGIAPASPTGLQGLARTLMALTIATTIAITLVIMLATDSKNELVKTIVTALVTSFTTIVGFYFGARTAETAHEAGAAAANQPGNGGGGGNGPGDRGAGEGGDVSAKIPEEESAQRPREPQP